MRHKIIPKLNESDIKRFWSFVNKKEDNDCWEWLGACEGSKGWHVPSFWIGGSRNNGGNYYNGYRVAYFIATNVDPCQYFICHKCDNSKCVNPKHLFLGTQSDNINDCVNKGRHTPRKGKYDDYDIQRVRLKYNQGKSFRQIAEETEISRESISRIINRKGYYSNC